jgi:hypothetical protein
MEISATEFTGENEERAVCLRFHMHIGSPVPDTDLNLPLHLPYPAGSSNTSAFAIHIE